MGSYRAKFGFIAILVSVSLLLANLPVAVAFGAPSAQVSTSGQLRPAEAPTATVTVGTGGTYPTLKTAFDDINSGILTGTIQLDIVSSTTETTTAVLNASNGITTSYTSVLIQPVGGAWVISGTMAAGSPLIDFNGADNVTINGQNTSGNALTIVNATVSATSGTSTIRFQADATNNTLTNLSILGSASMAVGTNGGNVWFGSAAISTGNDNNTVSNCNIGPAGSNLPTKGIYFSGSSNTDPGTANSGIVITNNNIYDYFGAATTSAGIYITSGSVGVTISNNKFYQTAPRTQTTGAQHSAIWITNSSGNNYQITGNTIGYASNNGTGVYTLVGVGSSVLIPIYLSVGTTTATSVQGNTIASMSLSGLVSGTGSSAPFRGIYVGGGLTTFGDVSGNIIGSQSITNSISITSTSASATDVMAMFNFGSSNWTVSNNLIGGIVAANTSTGAASVYGIRVNTSSTASFICQNNTIGGTVANSIQSTSTATGTTVQGLRNENPAGTITGNQIRNLTAAGGTGTTSSASVIGIAVTASFANHTLRQNTIHSLSNTNSSAATTVVGIQYTASTGTNLVARNLIHSFNAASPAALVNGLNVSGGTTTYQNNVIRLGIDAAGNSVTTGAAFSGINEPLGTDNFYFNSVYVGGTGVVSSTANSYAFNSQQTVSTRAFRDNVFVNARSNATGGGKHYGIRVAGTGVNPTGLTSNNNVITATGTGAVFGYYNGDTADLAAWRTATGQDTSSFALDPQFVAPTAATPDLHISSVITTVVEGNGFAIAAVTDDFDGEVRANLTPADIGADAGNFIGIDLTGPAITYTPFGSTSLTTNRLLAANIVDVSGVPTVGSLQPRLYYNKNGGTWYSAQGALASGTGLNGTWNFTLTVGDFGGVTAGDVISYFVIAQDTANPSNLVSSPAGAVASDVNTIITAPVPYTYTLVSAYSGAYNVGATEVYTSLTNAGGLFQAINAGALTGNVIVNITSDLTGESGAVALNQWSEDGAGGYTLLIQPSGATRVISGSNTGALIKLNGVDRVTINGSLSGGNDRSLTIQNTNTGTSAVVISVQTGTNGAQNNTLKNLTVLGQDPTTTLAAIALGGNTPGTAGADNDGNRVENCAINRVIYGIYSSGASAVNPNIGTVITGNDLSATGADRVRRVGIAIFNDAGPQITDNSVYVNTNESADGVGIGIGTQSIDSTTTTGGGVTNAWVARNRILGVSSSSTTGFSAVGIAVAGGAGSPNVLANNVVMSVTAPSTSPDLTAGIFVAGVSGSTTRLYYNSVALTGDRGTVASQMPSFALAVTGSDPAVEIKDNVFYTTQTASGGGASALSYAIGLVSTAFVNFDSNYNTFWSSGANDGGFRTGSLGAASGTSYANLAAWQTAVSDDANSVEADPQFIDSATNLHLQDASPVIWAGTPIAGITTDIDGDTRCVNAPSIGADEGQLVPAATFAIVPASPLAAQPVDFTATVLTGTAPFTYTWDFGDGTPFGSGNPVSHTYAAAGTYTATLTVNCKCGTAVVSQQISPSDAPTQPDLGELQASDPTALGNTTYFTGTLLAGSAPITYTWDFGDGTVIDGGLNITHTYLAVDFYTATLTAVNLAGTDVATSTLRVGLPPTASFDVTTNPTYYPDFTTFTFTGNPGTGPTTYLWTIGNVTYTVDAFTATLAAPAPINNYTSTLRVSNPYGTVVTGTVVTVLNTSADLGIAKSDSPDPVGGTQALTYTLTVSNFGPNALVGAPLATLPFTNSTFITIPAAGAATPYPSTINVAGVTDPIGKVRVTLSGFNHTWNNDVDVLLVGPHGQSVILMSDVGGGNVSTNLTFTFDDDAAASMPTTALSSGTFKPTNSGTGDTFDAPAPAGPYGSALSSFIGVDPNGAWQLYALDDASPDSGNISGGWSLELTTVQAVTTTVVDTLPAGYTFGSATGSGWTCANNSGTVTCTRGILALGAGPNIVITGNAPLLATSDTVTNTATVSSVLPDFNQSNNTATTATFVNALQSDLSVSKTDSRDPVGVGETVTYQITVTNIGPDANTNVAAVDTLPASFQFASASAGCANVSGTVTCAIGALSNGQSASVSIVVTATALGTYTNTVSVSGQNPDLVSGNNTATAATTVASPEISVNPGSLSTTQFPNVATTQTLTINNVGPVVLNWFTQESATRPQPTDLSSPAGPQVIERDAQARGKPVMLDRPAPLTPSGTAITLVNEGFESGLMPPAGWLTRTFSTSTRKWSLVDTVLNPTFVYTGTYSGWTNYDSALTQDEWLLSPQLVIPAGNTADVSFWALSDTGYPGATMTLYAIDASGAFTDTLWDLIADESWPTWSYRQVTRSLNAYQGKTIRLAWRYHGLDGESFGIDSILVTTTSPCDATDVLPWLTASPSSGSTAAGGNSSVNVQFNSTGLAAGVYTGKLCVASNDATDLIKMVPVTLTVQQPLGVTFVYHDLEDVIHAGETLNIAGTINGWNANATPMTGDAAGTVFSVTLNLAAGSYDYKYIVKSNGDQWDWLNTNNHTRNIVGAGVIDDYRNVVPGYQKLNGPASQTVTIGKPSPVITSQVYINNVTNPAGEARGVMAQMGYGQVVTVTSWTWADIAFTGNQSGNDDIYAGTFKPAATGVYSYAVRFNGNWGQGNPNSAWWYGDRHGVFPGQDFTVTQAGVLTVENAKLFLPLVRK